jgi:hypothetical protein
LQVFAWKFLTELLNRLVAGKPVTGADFAPLERDLRAVRLENDLGKIKNQGYQVRQFINNRGLQAMRIA